MINRRCGFTLTEVMMVVIILMIGIIPIYDSLVTGSKRTRFNRRRNFAASICNNTIELYKKMHIKTLVEKSSDIENLVIPNPGAERAEPTCEDPLLCPWKSQQIQDYMADDEEFAKLIKDFKHEFGIYKVQTKVAPTTKAGLKDKLCTFQVKVSYMDLVNKDKKEKTVAAGMVFSDPTFPAGKVIP